MERFNIEWQGQQYPAISFPKDIFGTGEEQEITIASSRLWDELCDEDGCLAKNAEAERLDNTIYGYLDDDTLAKSEKYIIDMVEKLFN